MTYRQRFDHTMRHEKTDRPPRDLAGTSLTGIEDGKTAAGLAAYLNVDKNPPPGPNLDWYRKFDDRVLRALDIDFRRVGDILEPASPLAFESETERVDCWGVKRVFTGMYWDIKDPPLSGSELGDLAKYPWPKAENLNMAQIARYADEAKRLYEETECVVCAEHPFYGVMELGCWMCGFDEFLLKMALEPEFVHTFFDIVLEYQKKVIKLYYGAVGPYIHLTTSGDDFGTQKAPFISPAMFGELVAPYYKERIRLTKQYTRGYFFHHTCGAVFDLLPALIGAGVDIINPIQPGAAGMEPERLKAEYGNDIVFWGGIDTQNLLRLSSPDDVRREAARITEIMGTGYVLAPAHNIQPDVPVENIAAVFQNREGAYEQFII